MRRQHSASQEKRLTQRDLNLGLQAPELWENKVPLLSHSVCGILLQQPELTDTPTMLYVSLVKPGSMGVHLCICIWWHICAHQIFAEWSHSRSKAGVPGSIPCEQAILCSAMIQVLFKLLPSPRSSVSPQQRDLIFFNLNPHRGYVLFWVFLIHFGETEP